MGDRERVAAEDRQAEVALRGEEHVAALEQEANRGLSSLTADQLAEKVTAEVPGAYRTMRYRDALAELCRRLKTAEDALERIVAGNWNFGNEQPGLTVGEYARDALAAIRPNPKP